MIVRVIAMLAIVCMVNEANASPLSAVGVRIGGVRSTLNVSSTSPDDGWQDLWDLGSLVRPSVVVWGEWFQRDRLSLVTEVAYTGRGRRDMSPSHIIYDTFGQTDKISRTSSYRTIEETAWYLSFPVLAKVTTPGPPAFEPYLVAGPRLDVLVNRSGNRTWYVRGFQRYLFGIDVGLGFQAPVSRSFLTVDLRYCMTPYYKTRNVYFWNGKQRVTARALQFTFGCRFPT
jgi:hypothetical protein